MNLDLESLYDTAQRIGDLTGDLSAMVEEDDREALAGTFDRIAAEARAEAKHIREGIR